MFAVWQVKRELTLPSVSGCSLVCVGSIADKSHSDAPQSPGRNSISVKIYCGQKSPVWLHRGLTELVLKVNKGPFTWRVLALVSPILGELGVGWPSLTSG